jgi:two-component system sensor histidine kinase KdpD
MRIQKSGEPKQRLLVAVSPSQISEQLVRRTHRLARALNCWWGAVYVEALPALPKEDQLQLSRTLALARMLGAEVLTTTDTDIVRGLLRAALQHGVTQVIIGKPVGSSYRRFFRSDRWLERLLRESGGIDIQVVRLKEEGDIKSISDHAPAHGSTLREYLAAVAVVLAATWAGRFAEVLVGYRAIAWIFLAVVVVMAAFVGRGPTLLAAVLSALLWDFLFVKPLYSFSVDSLDDWILLVVYFVVAVTLGQMTNRIREQEKAERERERRATALQLLTREVTEAPNLDDMLKRAVQHSAEVFKAEIAILLPSSSGQLCPHPASTFKIAEEENRVAAWVFKHGQSAGKFTANSPLAAAMYMPLAHDHTAGVMGLRLHQPIPLTIHQQNLLDAFSQQIATMIQRYQMQEVSEKSNLLAESERLSKTLLNSISHEIRTPLAVIQSATTNMVGFGNSDLSQTQKAMVAEIQEASERLNRLVGKVLDMTRLESGHLKPKFDLCEVGELVQMAEEETRKELAQHKVTIEMAPNLPLVRMDFELILHSLTNLLSNAAVHTPAGTEVKLSVKVDHRALLFTVADRGPGIPPQSIPHLFEKFYRAPTARTGGTGLGLSLVKGFVEAHGGQVDAQNLAEGGAEFTIRLPIENEF